MVIVESEAKLAADVEIEVEVEVDIVEIMEDGDDDAVLLAVECT